MKKEGTHMKNKILSIGICMLFLTIGFLTIVESVPATDWPMKGYDSGRTKFSISKAPGSTHLEWIYQYEDGVANYPIVANDKIFVYADNTSIGHSTICLDAETSEFIWIFPKGGISHCSPTFSDNMVYISDYTSKKLFCLDAEGNGDGTTNELWNYTSSYSAISPVILNGYLYCMGSKEVVCLDANPINDGIDEGFDDPDKVNYDLIWKYDIGHTIWIPAVANGNVYVASSDTIYCLDAKGNGDGTTDKLWEFPLITPDVLSYGAPVVKDGRLYFSRSKTDKANLTGMFYCLNATGNGDGTTDLLWTMETEYFVYEPAVTDDYVYLATNRDYNEYLYCLDKDGNDNGTANIIWRNTRGGKREPVIADGKLYATGLYDKFYCFDAATGEHLLWVYSDEDESMLTSAPIVCEIDNIGQVLLSFENGLHCLRSQPPAVPIIYKGQSEGDAGIEYFFEAITTDPNNLDISYLFDWGDNSISNWTSAVASGESIQAAHIWNGSGDFQIRVKAKNTDDIESDWSEPFILHINAIALDVHGGFGVNVQIRNTGTVSKKVNWKINITGGLFFKIDKSYSDSNVYLGSLENITVGTGPFLWLGMVDISATAECAGESIQTKMARGFVFFAYIIILG